MNIVPAWLRARLVPDAGTVAKRAWSLRFIEAAAVADIILNLVPVIGDFLPWWLTVALLSGAWIARHISQGGEDANQ